MRLGLLISITIAVSVWAGCYRDDDPNLPPPCSVFEPPCAILRDAGAG